MAKLFMREMEMNLIDEPVDAIRDSINPDRIRELAESIRERGLEQAIKVRPKGERYEIVFGHRRYLAHRLIGKDKIRAVVEELTDEEALISRAIENIQREDLNPVEQAKTYGRLRDNLGFSQEMIARKMGRGVSTVRKYLDILKFSEELKEAVAGGKISLGAAFLLDKIDDERMRLYYVQAGAENGITEKVAQGWLEQYEQTKAGNFYEAGGGGVSPINGGEPAPVFHTCVGCRGPVESKEIKYVGLCPGCIKEMNRA